MIPETNEAVRRVVYESIRMGLASGLTFTDIYDLLVQADGVNGESS